MCYYRYTGCRRVCTGPLMMAPNPKWAQTVQKVELYKSCHAAAKHCCTTTRSEHIVRTRVTSKTTVGACFHRCWYHQGARMSVTSKARMWCHQKHCRIKCFILHQHMLEHQMLMQWYFKHRLIRVSEAVSWYFSSNKVHKVAKCCKNRTIGMSNKTGDTQVE